MRRWKKKQMLKNLAFLSVALSCAANISPAYALDCGNDSGIQFDDPKKLVGGGLSNITIANINGDEAPDIAGTWDSSHIRLFESDGKGGYSSHPFSLEYNGVRYRGKNITFSDIDTDGDRDLAIHSTGGLFTVTLGGQGPVIHLVDSYKDANIRNTIDALDLDGDSREDIVVSVYRTLHIYFNDGVNDVGVPQYTLLKPDSAEGEVHSVADVNGDGRPDVAAVYGRKLNVCINRGNRSLKCNPSTFDSLELHNIALGDVDGDDKADLVGAETIDDRSSRVVFLRGAGDGTFAEPKEVLKTGLGYRIALVDIDSNGLKDIIYGSAIGAAVLPSRGDGAFGNKIQVGWGSGANIEAALGVIDLSSDGYPEILYSNVVYKEITRVDNRTFWCNGDLDCNGEVTFDDINPFVTLLADEAAYRRAMPECSRATGDIDNDGAVTFDDIDPFLELLQ